MTANRRNYPKPPAVCRAILGGFREQLLCGIKYPDSALAWADGEAESTHFSQSCLRTGWCDSCIAAWIKQPRHFWSLSRFDGICLTLVEPRYCEASKGRSYCWWCFASCSGVSRFLNYIWSSLLVLPKRSSIVQERERFLYRNTLEVALHHEVKQVAVSHLGELWLFGVLQF